MHLHNFEQHAVLISPTESEISDVLRKLGISVSPCQHIAQLRDNEQYHADIQACIIDYTAFIPDDCPETAKIVGEYGYNIVFCKPLSEKYPKNISLNVALIGDKLFCKESAAAPEIKNYCIDKGIKIINVNQGYTKCSTLILNSNAIITADETIYKATKSIGINALKIAPGHIYLKDADYGFIGGCSGVIGETVYFFGDIKTHPEARKIISFIEEQNMKYCSLSTGIMKDIGGFINLK